MSQNVMLGNEAEGIALKLRVRDLMLEHARSGARKNPTGYAGVYEGTTQTFLGVTITTANQPNWICVRGPRAQLFYENAFRLLDLIAPGSLGDKMHFADGTIREDHSN